MALSSKKFIVVAKRKESKGQLPAGMNQKMVRAVNQVFFHNYYFRLKQMTNDALANSTLEFVSKFTGETEAGRGVYPTLDQCGYYFNDIQLIQNPLATHRTMY